VDNMKKYYILGIALLILSLSVFGQSANKQVFETEFISESKFSVYGTLSNDYNEGNFYIDEGVYYLYAITSELPLYINFKSGIESDTDIYYCNNNINGLNLTSANGTVYGHCHIEGLNSTGHYHFFIKTSGNDNNKYILQSIEVNHSRIPLLSIILLIIGSIILIYSLFSKDGIAMLLSSILFTSASIDLCIVYNYVLGNLSFIPPIVMIMISLLLFANFIKENM